jgi:DNA-binding PadR family transcriptional regulator
MTNESFFDPPLLILTSLANGSKHGYGIMEDVKAQFGVRLGPGTLYGALARLEERGLIVAEAVDDTSLRKRRPYRLTEQGNTVLAQELDRLSRLATIGLQRLQNRTA